MCVFFHRVWFSSKRNHIHVTRDGFFNWDQIPNSAHNSINHRSNFEVRDQNLKYYHKCKNWNAFWKKQKLRWICETRVQTSKIDICQIRLFALNANPFNQCVSFANRQIKFQTSAHNSINHPSDFEERSKHEICIINVKAEMDFEKRKLGCIRETKVQRSKMEICQIRLFELDASAFN